MSNKHYQVDFKNIYNNWGGKVEKKYKSMKVRITGATGTKPNDQIYVQKCHMFIVMFKSVPTLSHCFVWLTELLGDLNETPG